MKPEEIEKLKKKLNPKQQLFCELYATTTEFYGNGTQAYIEAYQLDMTKPSSKNVVMASASRLLSNVKVLDYINAILVTGPLSAENLDKQLAFIVTQNTDIATKRAAIRDANQLKGRMTEKIEMTGQVDHKGLPENGEYLEFLKWKARNEKE